jgi:hypothetical protein
MSAPYQHSFDHRIGDALVLQGTYKDRVDTDDIDRAWTTEAVHFTVYSAVGTQAFTKDSATNPTLVVLTDGAYKVALPAGDSDLSALTAGIYLYELDEVDTDSLRHTRLMGTLQVVGKGGYPVYGKTERVNITIGTTQRDVFLQ